MAAEIVLSDNPNKMAKKIDKALAKMMDKWRRVKKKES